MMVYNHADNLGKYSKLGATPWNVGVPRTAEEKEKMSVARKEWMQTHEHPRGMLGKKHDPDIKKKLADNLKDPETRKKRKIAWDNYCLNKRVVFKCPECGKEESITRCAAKTRKYCSYHCAGMHKTHKGRVYVQKPMPNCLWCGKPLTKYNGKTQLCRVHSNTKRCKGLEPKSALNSQIRKCAKYVAWRQSCYTRDNFTCQKCGKNSNEVKLQLHHKETLSDLINKLNIKTVEGAVSVPEMWDMSNAVTLCISCHMRTDSYLGGAVRHFSDEVRKRISDAQKGKKLSQDHKDKISLFFNGRPSKRKGRHFPR